jgi:hypothetical protein
VSVDRTRFSSEDLCKFSWLPPLPYIFALLPPTDFDGVPVYIVTCYLVE